MTEASMTETPDNMTPDWLEEWAEESEAYEDLEEAAAIARLAAKLMRERDEARKLLGLAKETDLPRAIQSLLERLSEDERAALNFIIAGVRQAALAASRASEARLREALDKIANPKNPIDAILANNGPHLQGIADAALSASPTTGGERDALAEARAIRERAKAENRCEICDWPLAASPDKGCTPKVCSFTPAEFDWQYGKTKKRRDLMAALDAALSQQHDGETR